MDARIIKTKNKIKEGLLDILQTKRLNEVSISEICEKARVNRNTFYAHFATPEAVIDEIAEDYLTEQYGLFNNCTTTKDVVVTACKHIMRHANKNIILLKNRPLHSFIKRGVEYGTNTPIYVIDNSEKQYTEKELKTIQTYIVSGAVAIIMEWLYSGMQEMPEEVGERVDFINSALVAGINQSSKA